MLIHIAFTSTHKNIVVYIHTTKSRACGQATWVVPGDSVETYTLKFHPDLELEFTFIRSPKGFLSNEEVRYTGKVHLAKTNKLIMLIIDLEFKILVIHRITSTVDVYDYFVAICFSGHVVGIKNRKE